MSHLEPAKCQFLIICLIIIGDFGRSQFQNLFTLFYKICRYLNFQDSKPKMILLNKLNMLQKINFCNRKILKLFFRTLRATFSNSLCLHQKMINKLKGLAIPYQLLFYFFLCGPEMSLMHFVENAKIKSISIKVGIIVVTRYTRKIPQNYSMNWYFWKIPTCSFFFPEL